MSYGAQSNDALLQQYGFMEAGNPADRYVLMNAASKLLLAAGMEVAAGLQGGQLKGLVLTPSGADAAGMAAARQLLGAGDGEARAMLARACRWVPGERLRGRQPGAWQLHGTAPSLAGPVPGAPCREHLSGKPHQRLRHGRGMCMALSSPFALHGCPARHAGRSCKP
jgi:hypothetical protein